MKYKDLFEVSISRKLGALLRKYKKLFHSRKNLQGFISTNIRKAFFWENLINFFRAGIFRGGTSKCVRQLVFAKLYIVDVWQCSEYALGFEYTRFLNMFLMRNMSGFWKYLSRNMRKLRFLNIMGSLLRKCKKLFQNKFF